MPLRARKISWIVSLLLFLLRFYFFFFCYVNNIVLHFRFSLFIFYLNFPAWFIIFHHFLFLFFSLSNANNNYTFMSTQEFRYFIVKKLGLLKAVLDIFLYVLYYLARIKNIVVASYHEYYKKWVFCGCCKNWVFGTSRRHIILVNFYFIVSVEYLGRYKAKKKLDIKHYFTMLRA